MTPRPFVWSSTALTVLLLLVGLTAVAGCSRTETSPSSSVPDTRTSVPDTRTEEAPENYEELSEQSTSSSSKVVPQLPPELEAFLKSCEGRPVVLAFWSTHCPPCREETGRLGAFFRSLGHGVSFAIVATEKKEDAQAYLQKRGLEAVPLVEDEELDISNFYHVALIPSVVVLDAKREVITFLEGPVQESRLHVILAPFER
jgi:thiol-disulfide isomerase/thioredoxin